MRFVYQHGEGRDGFAESVYDGDVDEHQRPCGFGTQVYPNGITYEGQWMFGLYHGFGKLLFCQTVQILQGSTQIGLATDMRVSGCTHIVTGRAQSKTGK